MPTQYLPQPIGGCGEEAHYSPLRATYMAEQAARTLPRDDKSHDDQEPSIQVRGQVGGDASGPHNNAAIRTSSRNNLHTHNHHHTGL